MNIRSQAPTILIAGASEDTFPTLGALGYPLFVAVRSGTLSGLAPDLSRFALTPARLLLLLPAMEYWLSFQRSRFILNGKTRVITVATAVEVGAIALLMTAGIGLLGLVGVVAAATAQVLGRLGSNLFLRAASKPPPGAERAS